MKEFSKELHEERSFEIGGEVFKWRYPHWEEMAKIFDEDVEIIKSATSVDESGRSAEQKSTVEALEMTIGRIILFIDPDNDGIERFRALAARKERAVPLFLFSALYRWLLEVTSSRPTTPPSDLEPGGGSIEATSPDESSSQEEAQTA